MAKSFDCKLSRVSMLIGFALIWMALLVMLMPIANAQTSTPPSGTTSSSPPKIKLPTILPEKRRAFLRNTDLQLWTPVYLWTRRGRIRGFLEANPRIGLDTKQMDTFLLRPAVGFQLTRTVSIWQGYNWQNTWLPTYFYENRPFQQILVENRFHRWGMVNRTRLEERYIEHINDMSLRLRHFVRFTVPFKENSKWQAVASEELFINLNKAGNIGPGINQNRLFIGVNRQITRKMNMDFGYQYQYINRTAPVQDRHNHCLIIATYYTI